jgi:hypothetical protein
VRPASRAENPWRFCTRAHRRGAFCAVAGLCVGTLAHGARVWIGVCTEPQLRYSLGLKRVDGGCWRGVSVTPSRQTVRAFPIRSSGTVLPLVPAGLPQPFFRDHHPVNPVGLSDILCAMLATAFLATQKRRPPPCVRAGPYLLCPLPSGFQRAGLSVRANGKELMGRRTAKSVYGSREGGSATFSLAKENSRTGGKIWPRG